MLCPSNRENPSDAELPAEIQSEIEDLELEIEELQDKISELRQEIERLQNGY